MNKHISIFLGACFLIVCISCNKFIEVQPKGEIIPTIYQDFDLLLNNTSTHSGDAGGNLAATSNPNIVYLTDDVDLVAISGQEQDISTRAYMWADQLTLDVNSAPPFWSDGYANVHYYNVVLNGISESDTAAMAKKLRAEALFGRAYEYFYLVNVYAKEYSPASAGSDPAVPFVTSNSLEDKVPGRGTVQSLYKQLVSDVQTAVLSLPDNNNTNKYRPGKKAAYSLLARLHLHMNDYNKAEEYATLAIQGMQIFNLNTLEEYIFSYPDGRVSTILARYPVINAATNFSVSEDLFNIHEKQDSRLRFSYTNLDATGRGSHNFAMTNYTTWFFYTRNCGPSVEEMKLIIAEAAARRGSAADLTTALNNINEVRQNRIPPDSYTPLASSDQATVLGYIFDERRREFAFTGMRWFDMRRLDEEGLMPEVTRLTAGGAPFPSPDGGPAKLVHNSPKYVMQIPSKVSFFNPSMPLNPR